MKKVDTVALFILFFCICGAQLNSTQENETTLDEWPSSPDSDNTTSSNQEAPLFKDNIEIDAQEPLEIVKNAAEPTKELNDAQEIIFSEIVPQNSAVPNEIINNDTPPIIAVTPLDHATEELQKKAHLATITAEEVLNDQQQSNTTASGLLSTQKEDRSDRSNETEDDQPKNQTEDKKAEDIPSFSEWAQKQLEQVEKKEQANDSVPHYPPNNTKQGSGAKLRWKNYASVDCGAKVLLANPEAQNSWAILSPSKDEYKLNPCNGRIWFIVELCEAIQVQKIELANYELFSSSPREFTVSVSDRFPTRDWSLVGHFTAKDERDVQSFDVHSNTFGKYVKVEIKSHYGTEHYCLLSLFRAYGTSVFEVLQKDDPAHEPPDDVDEDDDETLHPQKGDQKNLLSSATDAVLSMVKKAAEVLGNKVNKTNNNNSSQANATQIMRSCTSPSHYVACNNCTDMLFGKIFELLSCRQRQIRNLVGIPFIGKALVNSAICQRFGFDFRDKAARSTRNACPKCVESFFPLPYLGAMCNSLAITYNKVVYNVSHLYANATEEKISEENLVQVEQQHVEVVKEAHEGLQEEVHQPTEPLVIEQHQDITSKSTCSTDTSQISPSKSFATQLPVHSELHTAQQADAGDLVGLAEQEIPPVEPTFVEINIEGLQEGEAPPESSGEENIDKLMTELNSEASPVTTSAPIGVSQGQKESVFLRLSNRIKALERNMSLSGQYLEELSKRYKKQVEEMQRVLEKTEQTLGDVTRKQEERHKQLEDKLESLTGALEAVLSERDSWKATTYWLFFALVLFLACFFFERRSASKPTQTPVRKPVEVQRRSSVDVVRRPSPKKKKRRPSDQALKIVASAASGDQPRKRKKKNSNPGTERFLPASTSSKIWTGQSEWVEDDKRHIEDVPDQSEQVFSIIEPPPAFIRTASHTRLARNSFKNGKVRPPSPVLSLNGTVSDEAPKKEKKGIKKLFKKVF